MPEPGLLAHSVDISFTRAKLGHDPGRLLRVRSRQRARVAHPLGHRLGEQGAVQPGQRGASAFHTEEGHVDLADVIAHVPVEDRVDTGGVSAHEHRPARELDVVRRLGADVQVGVLPEERGRYHLPAGELHLGEVVHLYYPQAQMRQVQPQ